jgi:hypothetical protein
LRVRKSPVQAQWIGSGWAALERELERSAALGRPARLWLRDDDAMTVTPQLERLIELAAEHRIPVVMAVIPARADAGLGARLNDVSHVRVAVHGYAHLNHAPAGEKKQELGPHRAAAIVHDELHRGLEKLGNMCPRQLIPMLVPPWNRIAEDLLPGLPGIGFRYLSTFGAESVQVQGLTQVNCRIDLIDWRGSRKTFPHDGLARQLAGVIAERRTVPGTPIGILSHHAAHDDEAWKFLAALFELAGHHAGAEWVWPDAASGSAAEQVLKPAASRQQ